MNLAVQMRDDSEEGLSPMNFIVNLTGAAFFHSASPMVPSMAGAASHAEDATVFGSSGVWTRNRP